jgi:hypothetical protein
MMSFYGFREPSGSLGPGNRRTEQPELMFPQISPYPLVRIYDPLPFLCARLGEQA